MTFRDNSSCVFPLVETKNEGSFFDGIDGCGMQCNNPMFTDEEHQSVHIFIGVLGFSCLLLTLIAAVSSM